MPRIPVRTEPYTSPSRQHRHYKNKRDQVLRALGKAAYINGSHFAIMWVSARGDVETYASEALQGRLDDWFIKRGITDEAKELVRASRNGHARAPPPPPLVFDGEDDNLDDETGGAISEDEHGGNDDRNFPSTSLLKQHASANSTPLIGGAVEDDVFTDAQAQGSVGRAKPQRSASLRSGRRAFPPLDTVGANELYRRAGDSATLDSAATAVPHSAFGMAFRSPFDFDPSSASSSMAPMANYGGYGQVPHSAPLRTDMAFPFQQQSYEHFSGGSSHQALLQRSVSANASLLLPQQQQSMATPAAVNTPITVSSPTGALVETTFNSMAARTAFLEHRFGQLQQGMCKTVAKAWIKIIEPKKQTRCPYNKGEEGKPDWWPLGVRHKEPDHLMKPERHALLLTILRSPRIKVARLQLATAEVVALIKADKVSLLMDVYRVAREEEKMRESGQELDAPATIAISTLEGWSEEGQCAVPVAERPASPGGVEATEEDASGTGSARKRAAPPRSSTPLARSASSTGGARATKRRGSSVFVNSYGGASADSSRFGGMTSGPNDASSATAATATSSRPGSRRSQGNAQTWLLHEATQHGIKRTSVSSHTLSTHGRTAAALTAANAAATAAAADSKNMFSLAQPHSHGNAVGFGQQSVSYGSNGEVHQQYGLITPMTGNTQLMDPAFLTAAKANDLQHDGAGNGNTHDARFPGYMSAPPAGHAHLFPHGAHFGNQPAFYNGHMARSADATAQAQAEEDSNLFGYAQQQQQQQQHGDEDSGSALGLHGIGGVSWNTNNFQGHFSNAAPRVHEHGSNAEAHNAAAAQTWWHVPPQRASGSNSANTSGAGAVLADASFETSFASTADSAGPATPPQGGSTPGHHRHQVNQQHPGKTHEGGGRITDAAQTSMLHGNDAVVNQPSYNLVAMNGGGDKHNVQQQRQHQGPHVRHASAVDAGNVSNAFGGWVYGGQS